MAFIKVIEPIEAKGRLKEIYDSLTIQRGRLAEVHKVQSLRPESIVKHMDLYMEIMYSKSELSRAQREMMAVVVSACNGCKYCIVHHSDALLAHWKDEKKVNLLKINWRKAGLNSAELALCDFAVELTLRPGEDDEKEIRKLKDAKLNDSAILDAALVVAYFNFVNRLVLSLGVNLEEKPAQGFHYE